MLLHRSPALTAIYNEIKNSERNRVLDLGSMNAGCFQLFSELSCKIQVQDLASSMRDGYDQFQQGNTDSAYSDLDLVSMLDRYDENEKFDVILAWDLFNYLSLEQINQLFEYLRPFCKSNTLLYMLRYVEKTIPCKPREFFVKDKYLLQVSEEAFVERPTANYSTVKLLKSLSGYYMQDTLLGQSGMLPGVTEHVLRFASSSESRHLISKSESSRQVSQFKTDVQGETKLHLSPSIAEVMSLLQIDDSLSVLDLGSPSHRPEDEIVEKAGAYFRIDLMSLLDRSRTKHVEELNLSVFDYHMSRKFDVILVWDLFNFCTPSQIAQLDKMLGSLSHENTFLLSFMYTGRKTPDRPSRFAVSNGNQVNITFTGVPVEPPESLTGVALLRLLDAFLMDKTYAYRDGMNRDIIEYIFGYNEPVALKQVPAPKAIVS